MRLHNLLNAITRQPTGTAGIWTCDLQIQLTPQPLRLTGSTAQATGVVAPFMEIADNFVGINVSTSVVVGEYVLFQSINLTVSRFSFTCSMIKVDAVVLSLKYTIHHTYSEYMAVSEWFFV